MSGSIHSLGQSPPDPSPPKGPLLNYKTSTEEFGGTFQTKPELRAMSCKSVFGLIFLGIIQGILNRAKADYLATIKMGSGSIYGEDIWYFVTSVDSSTPCTKAHRESSKDAGKLKMPPGRVLSTSKSTFLLGFHPRADVCSLENVTQPVCLYLTAFAKLYIRDILQMKESHQMSGIYLYNGHPIRRVDIMGTVISVRERDAFYSYGVDDATGVINCVCWKKWSNAESSGALVQHTGSGAAAHYKTMAVETVVGQKAENQIKRPKRDRSSLEGQTRVHEANEHFTNIFSDPAAPSTAGELSMTSQLKKLQETIEQKTKIEIGDVIRVRGYVHMFREEREIRASVYYKVDDPVWNIQIARMLELPTLYKKVYDQPFRSPALKDKEAPNNTDTLDLPGLTSLLSEKIKEFLQEEKVQTFYQQELETVECLRSLASQPLLHSTCSNQVESKNSSTSDTVHSVFKNAIQLLRERGLLFQKDAGCDKLYYVTSKDKDLHQKIYQIIKEECQKPNHVDKGCHLMHILSCVRLTLRWDLDKAVLQQVLESLEDRSDI
ncbi:hypothetical protein STEG23_025980, partial [Scotinomys teguina]